MLVLVGLLLIWSFRHPLHTRKKIWVRYSLYGFLGYVVLNTYFYMRPIDPLYERLVLKPPLFFLWVAYAWILAGRRL